MSGIGANLTKLSCRYHPEAELVDDYHAGDVVCSECGLVVGDRIIDVSSEWRTFGNDSDSKDMSRVGAAENPLLGGNDLATCIESGKGDYSDSSLRTYSNRRSSNSGERALQLAFREIKQIAERLNLPKIIADGAMHLFKQVHESKTLKGRSNDAIATACLYIECRRTGAPRTLKEVCGASKISKKDIGRAFKLIVKFMNTNVELISSADFMSRFCSRLYLPTYVQKAARHIAEKANALNLVSGRSPISVAAAAIYMAAQAGDCKKTAKDIGEITGVAEVTIKQSYRLIYPSAQELFPEDFKFATSIEHLSAL